MDLTPDEILKVLVESVRDPETGESLFCDARPDLYAYQVVATIGYLNRIRGGIRELESTIREQAVGEQDGYLLGVADDLIRLLRV